MHKTAPAPVVRTEDSPAYAVSPAADTKAADDLIIAQALAILERRAARGQTLESPAAVKSLLCLRAAGLEHEEFSLVFLDVQHRVIDIRAMFRGSISQASVYPREVVKAALACNAAAVILSHNHPSGVPEPSRADEYLTSTMKSALALVDVRVLDHIIVAGGVAVSMAERGLL